MTEQTAQEAWEQSPGFVYFIAAGDPADAIKIGISTEATLKSRIRRIQGSNHEKLKLLGLIRFSNMKDAEAHEQDLHKDFEQFQRHLKGTAGHEWFNPAQDIFDYINTDKEICPPPPELDITGLQTQTGSGPLSQYKDIDEFLDELQKNMTMDDHEKGEIKRFHDALVFPGILQRRCDVEVYVKDFHDVLMLPGYVSMLKGSLQFKLSDVPDKYVMLIYANGPKKGRMEINLKTHPKKTLIKDILYKHVNLDELPTCNSRKPYPSISWKDWKKHIDKFIRGFDQIAEESWKNQEQESA